MRPYLNIWTSIFYYRPNSIRVICMIMSIYLPPHVLCVDTGRSSETAKAHRG
eukprot:TRINITY_DN750_c0_g1_i1.p2 TRINITY_DN750_c0_g1~~TRINITY_DN750_c0_g1_i1.p2  ORF type:complete len:52 (+),score=12.73 TRINITY_DN750_c0_g1_i1:235-390(+)